MPETPNSTEPPELPADTYQQSITFDTDLLTMDFAYNFSKYSFWLMALGISSIIFGILLIATFWGIFICWLPIWTGALLYKAGSYSSKAYKYGESSYLERGLDCLNNFFKISGILALLIFILSIISIVYYALHDTRF